jgi:starch synthase
MRIVLASSEAVPFSKTGGLADVASALPKALAQAGHDVWLVTPYYPQLVPAGNVPDIRPTDIRLNISLGPKTTTGRVLESSLPRSNVRVCLIEQPDYFDRPGLYQDSRGDYRDNSERFIFFSRAVMETARQLDVRPDIFHANDWQTGLVPALLHIDYRQIAGFEHAASVFTIHNLAFQGQFWHWDMLLTGLDWKYFNWRQMEYFGQLNLMKTGLVFADKLTTVSPTYAREIQTPDAGCGLQGVLSHRRADLVGILNGVDTEIWNPATDPHIARNYTVETVCEGKAACKADLQRRMNLPVREDVPLIGSVSRITHQKGFDLVAQCMEGLLGLNLQMVFVGSGNPEFERMLRRLAEEHPDQVAVRIGFDEPLSHQVEAGADIYLMPSQFEPCGLNQMYSLIYGTVPIVREVGGLADSVVDANESNLARGTANGFSFREYRTEELMRAVARAIESYRRRDVWRQLIRTGMSRDWSWRRSAAEYVQVYEEACRKRRGEPMIGPRADHALSRNS